MLSNVGRRPLVVPRSIFEQCSSSRRKLIKISVRLCQSCFSCGRFNSFPSPFHSHFVRQSHTFHSLRIQFLSSYFQTYFFFLVAVAAQRYFWLRLNGLVLWCRLFPHLCVIAVNVFSALLPLTVSFARTYALYTSIYCLSFAENRRNQNGKWNSRWNHWRTML